MLRSITRIEKMHALKQKLRERGWLVGATPWFTNAVMNPDSLQEIQAVADEVEGSDQEDGDVGPVEGPKTESSIKLARRKATGSPKRVEALAAHISKPQLPELISRFLQDQIYPNPNISPFNIPLEACPRFNGKISIFHSAVARFFAPSDTCGAGGMYQE
ncbi:hypothetical protein V5O48_015461 [Marasmius crinis-equi]|uniref:Uncharacterized protein n=1 Tax=Marasmius crinis-equi TaxID=585013 RepID=A0ABR3EUT6_9AGAR